jgi:hypothetical protein
LKINKARQHSAFSPPCTTAAGARAFAEADRLCGLWAAGLGQVFSEEALHNIETVLGELLARLNRPLPTPNQELRQHVSC